MSTIGSPRSPTPSARVSMCLVTYTDSASYTASIANRISDGSIPSERPRTSAAPTPRTRPVPLTTYQRGNFINRRIRNAARHAPNANEGNSARPASMMNSEPIEKRPNPMAVKRSALSSPILERLIRKRSTPVMARTRTMYKTGFVGSFWSEKAR